LTPEGWLTVACVFCRTSGLLLGLPVFNTVGVPKHVSVLLGAVITMLIVPGLPVVPGEVTLFGSLVAIGSELMLGWTLAMSVRIIFSAMAVASEIISRQTGMGMAMFMDPVLQLQQSPIGVMASWCSGIVFLGLNLHLKFIEGVAYSFFWIPPGQAGSVTPALPLLLEATEIAILLGFQLSGPLLILVFLVNTFIGIMAKLAPKMNMFFSIGMTLNTMIGIVVFAFALPWMMVVHTSYLSASFDRFMQILALVD
jgi:flagellar biosynthetic protein FliR